MNNFMRIIFLMFFLLQISVVFSQDYITVDYAEVGDAYGPEKVVQPKYPKRVIERMASSKCIVTFTVNIEGKTENQRIIESTNKLIDKPCIKASKKLIYPKLLYKGNPVQVENVLYTYKFEVQNQ